MLYIIRHGKTDMNAKMLMQGRSDHPLNDAGMEPLPDVTARLGDFLEEIKKEAAEKNILLSTHAIAMKGALEYLTPDSHGRYWAKNIGNCDIYAADVIDGNYTVPAMIDDKNIYGLQKNCRTTEGHS